MEDLNDLIFDSDTGLYTDDCFDVEPSMSLKEMEIFISNDKDDDSKEIEDISFGHINQCPNLMIWKSLYRKMKNLPRKTRRMFNKSNKNDN